MRAALVVLDGWGLGDHDRRDAVKAADTPVVDGLVAAGASGRLDVAGRRVGLPEGQMGNSEVGHTNLGAGRVVRQAYTRIDDAVAAWRGDPVPGDAEPEPWAGNDALRAAFDHAADGGRLHLMGLVGHGGVHADQRHAVALLELAADRGLAPAVHAFLDGRDGPPTAGAGHLADLRAATADHAGHVATVTGRYWAMDRDENWDRTRRAYDAVVAREADHEVTDPVAAAESAYGRDTTDEFVEPTLVTGGAPVRDGDAVVWWNFRGDRARQLVSMLTGRAGAPDPPDPPAVALSTMTEYDERFSVPVAFPPPDLPDVLGSVLAAAGLTQLRAAESEKFAHVTYFLNGGRERQFDGESRLIVPSPDVPTYDETPAMSAAELTDRVVDRVAADGPDVLVLNYANPDMVGHTGDFDAAVAACEAVDEQVGRLDDALRAAGAHLLVTADHGNADDMGTPSDPHTAHTASPVPFVSLTPGAGPDGDRSGGRAVREGGSLCDVAPTLLSVLGVDRPAAMTGVDLRQSRDSGPDPAETR
jgi:2,3-bisphosphoglycerate-independent phosphoglycerate mutase